MNTLYPGPAIYSDCKAFRYRLERWYGDGPILAIVMLNPSTATEDTDDQTIRMVQTLSQRFGFGRALIGNLFAFRSKDKAGLASVRDPVGPDNDRHLAAMAAEADTIVVAWGAATKPPVEWRNRWREVTTILEEAGKPLFCLQHLDGDHPRHPQILIHDNPLPEWRRPL